MTNTISDLIHDALHQPPTAIAYDLSQRLAALNRGRALLEGDDGDFDVQGFVRAGLAEARILPSIHSQTATSWAGPGRPLHEEIENAWLEITWEGHRLDVVLSSWRAGGCPTERHYVIAEDAATARRFYTAVCAFATKVDHEILVFQGGYWQKSADLYRAIKGATFEGLVLRAGLKETIRDDFEQFFGARELYARHGVPWKRGVLMLGPPGNGKTHTIKALVNALGTPCLYVKSLKTQHATDHDCMRSIFQRARHTTPCVLVLEDIDALIDDKNRSFFLNELDGFAENTGVLTVATTNHPERLDPAILDRPSRFDRKYTFDPPGPAERAAFLSAWSERQPAEVRFSAAGIVRLAELTHELSFAYLKELCLSTMIRWISMAASGGRCQPEAIAAELADVLRGQVRAEPDGSTSRAPTSAPTSSHSVPPGR